jgi:hypothetical protein
MSNAYFIPKKPIDEPVKDNLPRSNGRIELEAIFAKMIENFVPPVDYKYPFMKEK